MDISSLCVAFFLLGTAVDVGGTLIPSFRHHVMNYGSRGIPPKTVKSTSPTNKNKGLLEYVGSIQVPHTWFTHYYIVSVASSLFWASQIITRGWLFRLLVSYSHLNTSESMSVNQVALAWTLMALQGGRRLYESLTLTKPSESKMWIGLWGIGIAYYIFIGVSVWIEGIRKSPCNQVVIPQTDHNSCTKCHGKSTEGCGILQTFTEDFHRRSPVCVGIRCAARLP
jgi:3-oxo-5-alpha-steroid 4-dehydrogenase 3